MMWRALLSVALVLLLIVLSFLVSRGRRPARNGRAKAGGGRSPRATNAVMVLYRKRSGATDVYMVQEHPSGEYGFPGGIVNQTDANAYAAASREFTEETGQKLPRLGDVRTLLWQGRTAIFVAETADELREGPVAGDGEVSRAMWMPVGTLRDAVQRRTPWTLRPCAVDSTRALLDARILPVS